MAELHSCARDGGDGSNDGGGGDESQIYEQRDKTKKKLM